ncbi:nucleotidyltransferase family protein [Citrifermentans bremense]|uniref:nucleotidyltransferase family protein n=1 Tax=Citrifermentans bremense TaxID=60035 RepID=UPI00047DBBEE|nr:nucleotidyltransferase domain-containing protein [Citrifermentans bremense]
MEEQHRIDLKQQEWELVKRILNQLVPGLEVWAFGSRTNGKAKRYSDLDLAVISQQPLPLATMAALREAFDESDLPMKVDVVDWATTREPFRKIISDNNVVVQPAKQC